MAKTSTGYATNVFINCQFDVEFEPPFHAIVFAVIQCGYTVRCTPELTIWALLGLTTA